MASETAIDRAFGSVADGEPVDWAALESQTSDEDARELLQQLHVVARLSGAHRTMTVPSPAETTTLATGPYATYHDFPATHWGRYRLVERIGSGTFGTVYRAWDPELEREIAIKLLHTGDGLAAEARDRVLREGRAIAKVRHPNVVSVFGVEVNDGRVGLCMELVSGRTLDDVVRDHGPLSAQEAAVIGQTVCSALSAVHAAGLIHRDVKARNVMREVGGRIVLMDFGTGHAFGDHVEGGRVMAGTPIYMAPEALTGAGASVAADIYSTGVLLFVLVTGHYPVSGTSLSEVEQAHARGDRHSVADFRHDLPHAFVRVVERALDPHPGRRQKNAARMMVELLAAAEGDPTPDHRPSPWAQTLAAVPTSAVRAGAAILGAILVCLALGFVNSWAFAYAFGLDATFALAETPLTWARWGAKSLVAPAVLMIAVTLVVLVALEVTRVVRRVWAAADHALATVARASARALRVTGLPATTAIAHLLVMGALAFSGWVVFGPFGPLLASCLTPVDQATDGALRRLAPANEVEHSAYRQVLTLGVLALLLGWSGVLRAASRHRQRLPGVVLGAGIASTALAVMLLNVPYRILWQSDFEKVTFRNVPCYAVATRADALRLICPGGQPRAVVARIDDPLLVRSGTVESAFATYGDRGR